MIDQNEGICFSIRNDCLILEFHENIPFYNRQTYSEKIKALFKKHLGLIENLKIKNIKDQSWFSLLWTPDKNFRGVTPKTSFLVHYSFNKSQEVKDKVSSFEILACLPFNFEENFWLSSFIEKKGAVLTFLKNHSNTKKNEEANETGINSVKYLIRKTSPNLSFHQSNSLLTMIFI